MLDNAHSLAAFSPELALGGALVLGLVALLLVGRLRTGWVEASVVAGEAVVVLGATAESAGLEELELEEAAV